MKRTLTKLCVMAMIIIAAACSKNDHEEEPPPPPDAPSGPKDEWREYSNTPKLLGQSNWSFTIGDSVYFAEYRNPVLNIFKISSKEWKTSISLPDDFHERSGSAVTVLGNKVFIGGGYFQNTPLFDWWEFTPSINQWKRLADCQFIHWGGISYIENNSLFVGLSLTLTDGPPIQKDFYKYDIRTNTWDAAPVSTAGKCGSYGFSFRLDTELYFGGGYEGLPDRYAPTTNCQNLNTPGFSFKSIASFPVENILGMNANAVTIDGKGYVITLNSKLYQFDPANGKWKEMKDSPRDKDNKNIHYLHKSGDKVLGFTETGNVFEYIYK